MVGMQVREWEAADVQGTANYPAGTVYAAFTPEMFRQDCADFHLTVEQAGSASARASVWWKNVPAVAGETPGVIGHFAADSANAARLVLDACCDKLAQEGCTLAVGPMNGSTWRSYRLVTWSNGAPPFFMEPSNPDAYPGYFRTAGFYDYEKYMSDFEGDMARTELPAAVARKNASAGIVVRGFDNADFYGELKRIYDVSCVSFRANPLYMDIDAQSYARQYSPFFGKVPEKLVLLAERGNELVGFLFAIPDFAQAARGEAIDTVIFKTIAVRPEVLHLGLGALLVDKVRNNAMDIGFKNAVYALMHQANTSRKTSARTVAVPLREYTLFARRLAP